MIKRINADLANDLGNLVHRTTAMIKQNFNSKVPRPSKSEGVDERLKDSAMETISEFFDHMDSLKFTTALEKLKEADCYILRFFAKLMQLPHLQRAERKDGT